MIGQIIFDSGGLRANQNVLRKFGMKLAILFTPLLWPHAELRWVNWLKLVQIPQSLIYIGHEKSSRNLHATIFCPFDIDYLSSPPETLSTITCNKIFAVVTHL